MRPATAIAGIAVGPWLTGTLAARQQALATLEVTDAATCKAMFPVFANARIVAGAPATDDIVKCELKPIDKGDYKRPVSDARLAALRAVFPQGVCDYTRKGVSQHPAQTWLSYPVTPAASTR